MLRRVLAVVGTVIAIGVAAQPAAAPYFTGPGGSRSRTRDQPRGTHRGGLAGPCEDQVTD